MAAGRAALSDNAANAAPTAMGRPRQYGKAAFAPVLRPERFSGKRECRP